MREEKGEQRGGGMGTGIKKQKDEEIKEKNCATSNGDKGVVRRGCAAGSARAHIHAHTYIRVVRVLVRACMCGCLRTAPCSVTLSNHISLPEETRACT